MVLLSIFRVGRRRDSSIDKDTSIDTGKSVLIHSNGKRFMDLTIPRGAQ